MMIVMHANATPEQIKEVITRIKAHNMSAHLSQGEERTVIGVVGDGRPLEQAQFLRLPGVARIVPISLPFKLASREFNPKDTIVRLNGVEIGGSAVIIIAGPCAVESREQLLETAHIVKEAGAHALRGGAYKPRTSPYSFQGLGEAGLKILAEAHEETGLPVVTEVTSPELVPLVAEYANVLQIGARNMQNYALLKAAGLSARPVLLKRGMSATINEFLMAAEYILSKGNSNVILCERGIRTFETATRNTTDINAIPVLKALSHLPVVLDPSHSTGHWEYVAAVAKAGVAAGADGVMVEVHPHPDEALSDGEQSLKPKRLSELVQQVQAIAQAIGREMAQTQAVMQAESLP
jgi:3-deoxy-7-phosphoheptulonate synthase